MNLLTLVTATLFSAISYSQTIDPAAIRKRLKEDTKLPLISSRTIYIQTSEGSNMNVDISSDGKMILFDFLSELFLLPSQGGKAIQLTKGMAVNSYPVWSTDNKKIAFISDATGVQQIHVINTTGDFQQTLGSGGQVSNELFWTLNDSFISDGYFFYHLSGGKYSMVRKSAYDRIAGKSERGEKIYIVEYANGEAKVIEHDLISGAKKTFPDKLNANVCNNIRISPNGQYLTYISGNSTGPMDSLMIIDIKSRNRRLLSSINVKNPGMLSKQRYSFSSDSKFIFIGYGGKIHKIDILSGKDVEVPFSVNAEIDLAPLNYNRFRLGKGDSLKVKYTRSGNLSPDGKYLIFSAVNQLFIMDVLNREIKKLTKEQYSEFQPSFSPSGKWISYVTWSDSEAGRICRISVDGHYKEELTSMAARYSNPVWSPSGKQIAYVQTSMDVVPSRDGNGVGAVYLMDVNTRGSRLIDNDVTISTIPVFSADGNWLMYSKKIDGRSALLCKSVKTDSLKVIAIEGEGFASNTVGIRQMLPSPDGQYLVYQYNDNLYLAHLVNYDTPSIIMDSKDFFPVIRFARGGIDPHWRHGGDYLGWSYGNKYYSIKTSDVVKDALKDIWLNKHSFLQYPKAIDIEIQPEKSIEIDLKVPIKSSKGILAFINARILTMHNGAIIEEGTVVVKDGRILSVGKAENVSVPDDAIVINSAGKTLMPGLIDLHSHMYSAVPADILIEQSWQPLVNLSYGVTSVRDPSGSYDTFGYSELTEFGKRIGPRLFTVGQAVRDYYAVRSLREASIIVKNRRKLGATYIKQYQLQTTIQKQWLLLASRKAKVNLTNEGYSDGPLLYIRMLKDGVTGIEHCPYWGEAYKDVIYLFSQSGTYLTPTLQVNIKDYSGNYTAKKYYAELYLAKEENKLKRFVPKNILNRMMKASVVISTSEPGFKSESIILARIRKMGGKVTAGSHGEYQGIGTHFELWALQLGGLTNLQALEAGTILAAEALGVQDDLGSIEAGKIADLIILDENPLEDIQNTTKMKFVMKAGVLYDSDTLDEVWPESKTGPTSWR